MKRAEHEGLAPWGSDDIFKLSVQELEDSHKLELERRDKIEKKAQANLATAALATSFGLGFIGLLPKSSEIEAQLVPTAAFAVLAFAAFVYLGMAAICAVRASAINKIFDRYLPARLQTEKYGFPTADENTKAQLATLIRLNEAYTLITVNFTAASGTAMRNGIVGLVAALGWHAATRFAPLVAP
ncbi:MAG: hypothetical protein QOF78_3034 [Phycisphaerales bacterium]|nr:hypothetical protein [Phycisphaerales bacterium]